MPPTQSLGSPLAQANAANADSLMPSDQVAYHESVAAPPALEPEKEYVSKIGILASSMPYYHNQYMAQKKAEAERAQQQISESEEMTPEETAYFSKLSLDPNPKVQTTEEQAANARHLKPHSRSTIQLQNITAEKHEGLAHAGSKKAKSMKWQFGIRSRNTPHEAMLCIYRALQAQGAQWEMPPPPECAPGEDPSPYPIHIEGATHLPKTFSSDKDGVADKNAEKGMDGIRDGKQLDSDGSALKRVDSDDIDPNVFPPNYIPKDPWIIRVRWRKDGMYPPGIAHPNSAHSSRIDLNNEDVSRRRDSLIGSLSSTTGSTTSVAGGTTHGGQTPIADSSCYVYMDVQLYTLEQGTYLVDFKCSGYEQIVERAISEVEKKMVGSGHRVLDKEVTSPQPFLDLTNKLVIHLASGG